MYMYSHVWVMVVTKQDLHSSSSRKCMYMYTLSSHSSYSYCFVQHSTCMASLKGQVAVVQLLLQGHADVSIKFVIRCMYSRYSGSALCAFVAQIVMTSGCGMSWHCRVQW